MSLDSGPCEQVQRESGLLECRSHHAEGLAEVGGIYQ